MARQHGFDGLLTISNQIRVDARELPFAVDKRKVGRLTVLHLSWWRVLTEAIVQHRFRGIDDPDQAWILGELIRYLDDEKSGSSGFEGMGEEWVRVREGARHETLRPSDPEATTIAARWQQFIEYLCLHLSQELGVTVKHKRPSGKSAGELIGGATQQLADLGTLTGSVLVPDAIGPVEIEANLRTGRVTTSVELAAPKEGRPRTRINWLLRQLKDAPADLRVEVRFAQIRSTRSELLRDCRENPDCLLLEDEPKREPRSFVLALSRTMGKKRGRSDGSFISEARKQAMDFYRDLVQDLQPAQAKPPRLREPEEEKRAEQPPAAPGDESQARREQAAKLESVAAFSRFVPSEDA
jgi:hypothetical protein